MDSQQRRLCMLLLVMDGLQSDVVFFIHFRPYAMNTEFSRVIASEMKACNESREYDSLTRVHGQIDELKDIMVKNIENVTARGERLELLVNKSENLRDNVS